MPSTTLGNKENNIIIVDKCDFMRNTLKNMIINYNGDIHEASDVVGALSLALRHEPNIVFVSMEGNKCWPSLVQCLKKRGECTVVAYSTGITLDAVASAYFAGVDEILVNPQNHRERVEKYINRSLVLKGEGYYSFPGKKNVGKVPHLKKFRQQNI